jgi:hypothetical protein
MAIASEFWFSTGASNPVSLDATASVGDLGGSNVSRINDGLATPLFTTTSTPTDGQVICKLDFGSAQLVAGFRAVNTKQAGSSDGVTMRIEQSSDDSSWTIFGTAWLISPGTTEHTETQTPTAVTKRYWRLVANQNFDGVASIGEMELYAATGLMP